MTGVRRQPSNENTIQTVFSASNDRPQRITNRLYKGVAEIKCQVAKRKHSLPGGSSALPFAWRRGGVLIQSNTGWLA